MVSTNLNSVSHGLPILTTCLDSLDHFVLVPGQFSSDWSGLLCLYFTRPLQNDLLFGYDSFQTVA